LEDFSEKRTVFKKVKPEFRPFMRDRSTELLDVSTHNVSSCEDLDTVSVNPPKTPHDISTDELPPENKNDPPKYLPNVP